MYHWEEFEAKMAEVVEAVDAAAAGAAGAAADVDTSTVVDDGALGHEEMSAGGVQEGKVWTGQRGARDSAMSATA